METALGESDQMVAATEERNAISEACKLYRDSFDASAQSFADALEEAMHLYHEHLTVAEFNQDVEMLPEWPR